MLSIYICEDNVRQRKMLEQIVKSYIAVKNYNMKVVFSGDDPEALLRELEKRPTWQSLYILDVDLQHEMNGIVLASEIRKRDIYGSIVFVTTHEELSPLTFKYKVEAMDYISKNIPDSIITKIEECMDLAYRYMNDEKSSKNRGYQVKDGNTIRFVPFDDIIFFESSTQSSRKVILHMENSWLEFYGSLSEVEKIGSEFFRCHQSYVINLNNIESIDKEKREVEMRGGRMAFIAKRRVSALLKHMEQ